MNSFYSGFEKRAADVNKKDLEYLFKKHEARETFEQENEESPKEQKLEERLGVEKQAFELGFLKQARKLSTKMRNDLPSSDFVFPEERRYPIPDESHGRSALSMVAKHGTPDEQKKVRAAVHQRYPHLGGQE